MAVLDGSHERAVPGDATDAALRQPGGSRNGEERGIMALITFGTCWKCRCEMALPEELYNAAKRSSEIKIFCSYGHPGVLKEGETEADKLRRERDRLAQRVAEKDDEIARQRSLREAAERQLSATKGIVTRIKNRVSRGVCPCCNRSFTNLARHMAGKHPGYTGADEKEVAA